MIVGQVLYYVPTHARGIPAEVTIVSLGRKWATLSNGNRCDKTTGWVDGRGYTTPGRCWPSKEAWEEHRNVECAWQALKGAMGYRLPPVGVTCADITKVCELLKLEPTK